MTSPASPVLSPAMAHAVELAQQERLGEAEALLSQVIEAEPGNPQALQMHAMMALRQGRHADAIPRLRAALELASGADG